MLNIRKAGHGELERYYPLFELDFDKKEQLGKLALHKGLLSGSWELLIFYDDERRIDLAYALVGVKNLYGYVLLKHIAVLPWYREKGLGVEVMRMLNKRYEDRQGVIAEITELGDRDEKKLRKLTRFFERFGYAEAERGCNIGGARAHIMVKPIRGSADIAPVAHRIISDFYTDLLGEGGTKRYITFEK